MRTSLFRLALLLPMAVVACHADAPTAPSEPALARASKPGGGTTGIVPIKLGNLKNIGCSGAHATSMGTDAGGATMVVGYAFCSGGKNKPFIWSANGGLFPTGGSSDGGATAVGASVVAGWGMGSGTIRVAGILDRYGTVDVELPLPTGFTGATTTAITPDGTRIVGHGGAAGGPTRALRWSYSGGNWTVEEVGNGWASAVSATGDLIVGADRGVQTRRAVVWRLIGGSWVREYLTSPGSGDLPDISVANDISADGTAIAGTRWVPLARDPSIEVDQHVAWVANGSGWDQVLLKGADPDFDEGEAYGVARLVDGSAIVVGYSWEDTSGPGGKQWAVVWRRAGGATTFDPPIRLQPLVKSYGAIARDINVRGEVAGFAWTGNSSQPVMWKLP